ncbi:Sugar phosphate permease [Arboricoccus pini]|uniref:Sugar phosphate permease n=1 Tax=Arboricoccus pini TaxID=1963835 RepID=A0A212RUK3_9PROT|nr:MFS transporter [Arboricoccus pini]SNB76371.1 Sugar phosphate permease [Arboricoccus pini]
MAATLLPLAKADEDPATAVYQKVLWRIVPLLLLGYIVAYLDRVNVGFAKLEMLGDLGLSDTVYAIGASIFFWGYVILEVPSNLLLERFGARAWIARIMVSWGLIVIAMMYIEPLATLFDVQNSTMFYTLRFLLGACEAGFFPGVIFYFNQWLPSDRQSKVMSGFLLALPLSLVIGAPLSGWLMDSTHGFWGMNGWRWMLGLEGLPAIILGVVMFLLLDDKPAKAKWLNADERQIIEANLKRDDRHKNHSFGAALRDYRVWLMVGIIFTYNTGFYGLSFWLPTIIKAGGIESSFHIGLLAAIPYACACVVMVVNAAHSARTGERRWHAAIPALIGAIGLILSAIFANNLPLSIVFLACAASGVLGLMPVFWTFPGAILSGSAAAAGIALINCLGSLSGVTGSLITGYMHAWTGSYSSGTYVLGASLLLTVIFILAIPAHTLRPHTLETTESRPERPSRA